MVTVYEFKAKKGKMEGAANKESCRRQTARRRRGKGEKAASKGGAIYGIL
jgi:hypothetical protein